MAPRSNPSLSRKNPSVKHQHQNCGMRKASWTSAEEYSFLASRLRCICQGLQLLRLARYRTRPLLATSWWSPWPNPSPLRRAPRQSQHQTSWLRKVRKVSWATAAECSFLASRLRCICQYLQPLRKSLHGRHVIERHLGATQPPKIDLTNFQRRRELRLVRICFVQILVELCKLVLKRLFEHLEVVSSVRLRVASVAELGLGLFQENHWAHQRCLSCGFCMPQPPERTTHRHYRCLIVSFFWSSSILMGIDTQHWVDFNPPTGLSVLDNWISGLWLGLLGTFTTSSNFWIKFFDPINFEVTQKLSRTFFLQILSQQQFRYDELGVYRQGWLHNIESDRTSILFRGASCKSTPYIVSWCLFHFFCLYDAKCRLVKLSSCGSLCSLFMGFTTVMKTIRLLLKFCPPAINPEFVMDCKLIAHPIW